MDKLDICTVADWFLTHESMTHKKLQKLLYFSYGYYIASYNNNVSKLENEMFENDFEAWVHGPVSPKIYNLYRDAGYKIISKDKNTPVILTEKVEDVLFLVLNRFMDKDGDDLERMTHNQFPWLNARNGLSPIEPCSNPITKEDIFVFFKESNMTI